MGESHRWEGVFVTLKKLFLSDKIRDAARRMKRAENELWKARQELFVARKSSRLAEDTEYHAFHILESCKDNLAKLCNKERKMKELAARRK